MLQTPSLRFPGAEKERFRVAAHERLQDGLSLGPDGNQPPVPSPAVLVVAALVNPDLARLVDIAGPHGHDIIRTHPGQPLDLDHGTDVGRHEGQRCVDVLVLHRLDRLGLACFGAAEPEAGKGLQAVERGRRHQFFRDGPLENPLDTADAAIDDVVAQVLLADHVPANGLQGLGAKIGGLGQSVQLAKGPDRFLHALQLFG